jgi:hypothetical protein
MAIESKLLNENVHECVSHTESVPGSGAAHIGASTPCHTCWNTCSPVAKRSAECCVTIG